MVKECPSLRARLCGLRAARLFSLLLLRRSLLQPGLVGSHSPPPPAPGRALRSPLAPRPIWLCALAAAGFPPAPADLLRRRSWLRLGCLRAGRRVDDRIRSLAAPTTTAATAATATTVALVWNDRAHDGRIGLDERRFHAAFRNFQMGGPSDAIEEQLPVI